MSQLKQPENQIKTPAPPMALTRPNARVARDDDRPDSVLRGRRAAQAPLAANTRPSLPRRKWEVARSRKRLRIIAAGVALAAVVFGGTIATPAPASAKVTKYLETNCAVPAMVSKGPKDDGCLTWGTPHWVELGRNSKPLPPQITDSISGCAHDGLYQLVEAWSSEDGPIPPQYKKVLSVGYFAVGCVQGITQAMVKLNN